MKHTPPPGSDAAIELGCKCPILDNAHGHGYMGQQGIYVMREDCPVHVAGCTIDILHDPNVIEDADDMNEPLNSFYRDSCDASDECTSCQ
jgi:hypothetical protein